MEHRLTILWITQAIALPLGFLAIAYQISIWTQGKVYQGGHLVERGKFGSVFRSTLKTIFSPRVFPILRTFIVDGLFHSRLAKEDKLRWGGHTSLVVGFLGLFVLSSITGFCEEILHHFLHVEHPLVLAIIDKNNPIMALLNEVLGVLILGGVGFYLVRRYIARPAQLETRSTDTVMIVLLAVLMITSYPTESLRYLMEGLPVANGWYGFIGYALAWVLAPLKMSAHTLQVIHFWLFMVHLISGALLFVYMPFSKFFHILVSPVVVTVNQTRKAAA